MSCTEKIKNLFRTWNAEIESIITLHTIGQNISTLKLKESLGGSITPKEKISKALFFIADQSGILNRLNDIYKAALATKDKLLQGTL